MRGLLALGVLSGAAAGADADGLSDWLHARPVNRPIVATRYPPAVNGAAALSNVVALLAHAPQREAGTPGGARAARWLHDRFAGLGWETRLDAFDDAATDGPLRFHNVIAWHAGAGPGVALIVSHHDTKAGLGPTFVGANDSGSSSGLLLELARAWAAAPPPLGILLASVDGEECLRHYGPGDGLHGSRRLAAQLAAAPWRAQVRAVIVVDMIGDCDLTLTLPRNVTPALLRRLFDTARRLGVRERLSLAPGEILDDHVPFGERGFPVVNLIDFEYGSRAGLNDYWHTPADTADKLAPESLALVGNLVVELVADLARPPVGAGRGEARRR